MFSAILFDLDNTLIDRDDAFSQLVHWAFSNPNEIKFLIELDDSGYGNRESLFTYWERISGQAMDMPTFGAQLTNFVFPNESLLSSLECLAETTTIGIITNGGTTTQEAKWFAAGLEKVVPRNRLWISGELGVEKPNPAIFQLACQQLGFLPSECLFVGDQPAIDIDGANSAGLKTKLATEPLTGEQIVRDFIAEYANGR